MDEKKNEIILFENQGVKLEVNLYITIFSIFELLYIFYNKNKYLSILHGKIINYFYLKVSRHQSFVQKGIGVKYKTIHIWSYPQNLAIPCYY